MTLHANPTAHPHLYDLTFALTALAPRYWRKRP